MLTKVSRRLHVSVVVRMTERFQRRLVMIPGQGGIRPGGNWQTREACIPIITVSWHDRWRHVTSRFRFRRIQSTWLNGIIASVLDRAALWGAFASLTSSHPMWPNLNWPCFIWADLAVSARLWSDPVRRAATNRTKLGVLYFVLIGGIHGELSRFTAHSLSLGPDEMRWGEISDVNVPVQCTRP